MRHRKGIGIVFFVIAAFLILSAVVMFLWNFVLVPTTGVGALTYLQAMGLLVLSKILFGGFKGGRRGGPPWRKSHWGRRWSRMSTEEKERFKEEWRRRCAPGESKESP